MRRPASPSAVLLSLMKKHTQKKGKAESGIIQHIS